MDPATIFDLLSLLAQRRSASSAVPTVADIQTAADVTTAHDAAQDSRITALEARVRTLESSIRLMVQAGLGAAGLAAQVQK